MSSAEMNTKGEGAVEGEVQDGTDLD